MSPSPRVDYQTDPTQYKHWKLRFEGPVATLAADFDEAGGIRPGYNRYLMAVIGFVDDAVRPFLAIFRRFIPSFGGFDFSPIVALVVLRIVSVALANAIRG